MSDTLYLKLEQNIMVSHPHVYLQDLAELSCSDQNILNRLRVLPVLNLDPHKPGRYVVSSMELIKKIQQKEPNLDISHIGEPVFIVTYQDKDQKNPLWSWIKIAFVCLATFFGSSFSIMTFNNDVDISSLFGQICTLTMGQPSEGTSILEVSYSVGIGLGVLVFFNHFGRKKLTADPTPMQVQMRTYEDDVNNTIIEDQSRERNRNDAS